MQLPPDFQLDEIGNRFRIPSGNGFGNEIADLISPGRDVIDHQPLEGNVYRILQRHIPFSSAPAVRRIRSVAAADLRVFPLQVLSNLTLQFLPDRRNHVLQSGIEHRLPERTSSSNAANFGAGAKIFHDAPEPLIERSAVPANYSADLLKPTLSRHAQSRRRFCGRNISEKSDPFALPIFSDDRWLERRDRRTGEPADCVHHFHVTSRIEQSRNRGVGQRREIKPAHRFTRHTGNKLQNRPIIRGLEQHGNQ